MQRSPFRHIVLPALLAASSGFALLTWPMASANASRMVTRLPEPARGWVTPALTTVEHKEFSIRYIGFSILTSVAIGVGTAKVMRVHQSRTQHRQALLNQLLPTSPAAADPWPVPLDLDHDSPDHGSPDHESPIDTAVFWGAGGVAPDGLDSPSTLDWSQLSQLEAEPAVSVELPLAGVLATPLVDQQVHRLAGNDQQQRLAIRVGGMVYSFYRHRPTLEKAQHLLVWLEQQGRTAIATQDSLGYGVWVRQSNFF